MISLGEWTTGESFCTVDSEIAQKNMKLFKHAMVRYLRGLEGLAAVAADLSAAIKSNKDMPTRIARSSPRTFRVYSKNYPTKTGERLTRKHVIALNPDLAR